jgi:hypothetical protein
MIHEALFFLSLLGFQDPNTCLYMETRLKYSDKWIVRNKKKCFEGCLNNSFLDTLPGKQLEDLMYSPLGNWYNLEILTLAKNS